MEEMTHPLIQHKITILRDKRTGPKQFRELVNEISMLMCYEVLRELPTELVDIDTPLTRTKSHYLSGKKLAIVPILRAGLGMLDGILSLVPSAKIGHIGLYRDHETLEPHDYYSKLPDNINERLAIILDPMLATGGSAVVATNFIKRSGCKNIRFMSIIAAPEGIKRMAEVHPDVKIYCGHLDQRLNAQGYILPGLGDAGDRLFGTK
ncbi:MAG: uracil phosphoribosyltransferase [Clostridiales bacterium]|jgi:uracil phosphoribosyltransferase|nr:uracil phosphoribosyltransferase [Clostridiales bacterium]